MTLISGFGSILSQFDMNQLANKILKQATECGATGADVGISKETGFAISVRMGEVETIEHHQDKGISLTVYVGKKTGNASTSDFSEDAIRSTVEKAYSIAKYTQDDDCAGLADKELMATKFPDLDLYHPWKISPEHAVELAKECENTARKQDKRIHNSEGASVSTYETQYVYANTHGFIGNMHTTRHSMDITLLAKEKNRMERDYDYTVARDANGLLDINSLAKQAANKTVRRLNARKLKTQHVPIIFEAKLARGLLGHFVSAISGGNLYRKSSFLLDQIEKPIFPEFITIEQKPFLKKGLGSAAFDDEGVQTVKRKFIDNGILKSYVLGSYSARKLGLQSTGNAGGVYNLFVNTSDKDFNQLLKEMDTGLLVTELIGQGVNIVTGDYSRGAFGYWVEKGEIQYPVHEITIAGNLKKMYQGIKAIGNDVDHRGNVHTGSILIDNIIIAG